MRQRCEDGVRERPLQRLHSEQDGGMTPNAPHARVNTKRRLAICLQPLVCSSGPSRRDVAVCTADGHVTADADQGGGSSSALRPKTCAESGRSPSCSHAGARRSRPARSSRISLEEKVKDDNVVRKKGKSCILRGDQQGAAAPRLPWTSPLKCLSSGIQSDCKVAVGGGRVTYFRVSIFRVKAQTDGHQQLLQRPRHLPLDALLQGLPADVLVFEQSCAERRAGTLCSERRAAERLRGTLERERETGYFVSAGGRFSGRGRRRIWIHPFPTSSPRRRRGSVWRYGVYRNIYV